MKRRTGESKYDELTERRDHRDLAGELALVFREIFFLLDRDHDGFGGHRTVGAGRPGLGEGEEREALRFDHLGGEAVVGPAPSERAPGLEVDVRQAPLGELRLEHSAAARMPGELVRRGPWTSVR